MYEAGVNNYKELAKRLAADDPTSEDTGTSLVTLVNRGTFSFAFVLRVCRALQVRTLDVNRVVDDPNFNKAAD